MSMAEPIDTDRCKLTLLLLLSEYRLFSFTVLCTKKKEDFKFQVHISSNKSKLKVTWLIFQEIL